MTDNIEFLGCTLVVAWDYNEGEKRTHDYSGSPETVTVTSVTVTEAEIEIVSELPAQHIEELEELILNKYYR